MTVGIERGVVGVGIQSDTRRAPVALGDFGSRESRH